MNARDTTTTNEMNERTHQHCASANQTRSGHDDVPLEDGAEKIRADFSSSSSHNCRK